ncbi:QueT transporter family protein [Acholeplasma sp. OttesenSCG-928-E16]|nr:QueT transporter family protein [Acholeplasma sp. OttesenSCG-928-E16]
MKFTIKDLARQAVFAALYFAFTMVVLPIAHGNIQFRLSEALMILVLFDKKATIGLTIGCFFANLVNVASMPFDLIFGTLGTLLGCLLMIPFKNAFVSLLMPVITNSFLVPVSLVIAFPSSEVVNGNPYFFYCFTVFIGEFVCLYILGLVLYYILRKNKDFVSLVGGKMENKAISSDKEA